MTRIAVLLNVLLSIFAVTFAQETCDDGRTNPAKPSTGIPAEWLRSHGNDRGLSSEVYKLKVDKREEEIDDAIDRAVARNGSDWRFLWATAELLWGLDHRGVTVAGKFKRGQYHTGGAWADCEDRDQARGLQLLTQAARLADHDPNPDAAAEFYLSFSGRWLQHPQLLTNIDVLPNATNVPPVPGPREMRFKGTPNEPGVTVNSVLFKVPASFEAAVCDGERWRWCLQRAAELSPPRKADVDYALTRRLYTLDAAGISGQEFYFLSDPRRVFADYFRAVAEEEPPATDNPFLLTKLADDETAAQTARGIQRLTIPDELNYLKQIRRIANGGGTFSILAKDDLALALLDRLKLEESAEVLRQTIRDYGDPNFSRKQKLDAIVNTWGEFETTYFQAAAGSDVKLAYRSRNGHTLTLQARPIDIHKVLAEEQAALKDPTKKLDRERMDVERLYWALLKEDVPAYLGAKVAEWSVDLQPRADHLDRVDEIAAPLKKPGTYLLVATLDKEPASRAILWIDELAILRMPAERPTYFVCDAKTGREVGGATVEFFGFTRPDPNADLRGIHGQFMARMHEFTRDELQLVELTEKTDAGGFVIPKIERPADDRNLFFQVMATTADGRFAHLGYRQEYFFHFAEKTDDAVRTYFVTDAGMGEKGSRQDSYNVGEPIHYQGWFAPLNLPKIPVTDYMQKPLRIDVGDFDNQTVATLPVTTDEFGGFHGEYLPDAKVKLGWYHHLNLVAKFMPDWPRSGFVVSQKSPEPGLALTIDPPEQPLVLGSLLQTTVHSRTRDGAPAPGVHIKYEIMRACPLESWCEAGEWDWHYGRGYGWIGPEHRDYPGWENWGQPDPHPSWSTGYSHTVLNGECVTGADGAGRIEYDTAFAKVLGGDSDQRFDIRAVCCDAPGVSAVRCIEAEGRPLRVFMQRDRGFYRTDQPVKIGTLARKAGGSSVGGDGEFTLYRVTYETSADGKAPTSKPIETVVKSWKRETGDAGRAQLQIDPLPQGQYRLGYRLASKDGLTAEGGDLFWVLGKEFDGAGGHFNPLELIPDRREYALGDTARVLINTERPDSTVLFFICNHDDPTPQPQVLHLKGKSMVVEVPIHPNDVSDVSVGAKMVEDGRVYELGQNLIIPPVDFVAKLELKPVKLRFKPGETLTLPIRLSNALGTAPLAGSALLRISDATRADGYDPDLRAYFAGVSRNGSFGWLSSLAHSNEDGFPYNDFRWTLNDKIDQNPGRPSLFGQVLLNWFGHRHGRGFRGGQIDGNGFKFYSGTPSRFKPSPGDGAYVESSPHCVYWKSGIAIGTDGTATVDVPLPGRAGTWKILVQAMGAGSRPGQGEIQVETRGE